MFMISSCSNSAGKPPGSVGSAPESAGSVSSGDPASVADGNFSAVFDGQSISGTGTDEPMQLTNSAFVYPDGDSKKKLLIDVCDWTKPGEKFTHFFRLWLPDETGAWTITHASPDHNKYMILADVETDEHGHYTSDSVTMTITSITSTRVTGKFSGHFKLSNDTPASTKKTVDVTDGQFDVPLATSKVRPV